MNGLAIALVVISAGMHATWNVMGRSGSGGVTRFFLANATGALLLVPVVAWNIGWVGDFPPEVWWLLIATGAFQALYSVGLSFAYRGGAISFSYPVIRSLPIVLVSLLIVLMGRGGELSGRYWGGVVLIVGGILCKLPRADLLRRVPVWPIVTAACGTAGYSLIDEGALHSLALAFPNSSPFRVAVVYIALQALLTVAWMAPVMVGERLRGAEKRSMRSVVRGAVPMGIVLYATYFLVLTAITISPNVGYVVALRQLSLPIVTVVGVTFFGERIDRRGVVGLLLILAGLVGVAV